MRFPFCSKEEKIAGMLAVHQSRQDLDPALLDHARKCSRCSEIVFALETLQDSRASTTMSAHTASPGYLWWRSQLRRQSYAAEQMAKPVIWAEGLALICMLCMVAGFCFWQRAQLRDLFSSFLGLSILAGLTTILCVGGLTLFLSDRRQ